MGKQTKSIPAQRPEQLRGYINQSERQIEYTEARIDSIKTLYRRLLTLQLLSYDELAEVQDADIKIVASKRHILSHYLESFQQVDNNIEHFAVVLRLQRHNMDITRRFMLRYDPDEWQFRSKLRRHDYAMKQIDTILEMINQIHSFVPAQTKEISAIRDDSVAARREKRLLRTRQNFTNLQQNHEAICQILHEYQCD